jgi:nucleoside-diphosphate-sugar epimerase
MHVLLIGGTRFIGHYLALRLVAQGNRVTVLNRGITPDALGPRVERIRADRTTDAFDAALAGARFDAVVDFAAYRPEDIERAVRVLRGSIGHYFFISTGQVYLVLEGSPRPARESDYDGKLMAPPEDAATQGEWAYGVLKRRCEEVLVRENDFSSTRVRIPMVNGERDYYRRLESYLWRMLDGGPLLVPDGGTEVCRHVYGLDVADFIASALGDTRLMGRAVNLAQSEAPPLSELLRLLAEPLGAPDRQVVVSSQAIAAAGLRIQEVSPYSTSWMSYLDPSLATGDYGFRSTGLREVLARVVVAFLTSPPAMPPPGYEARATELMLAARGR